MWESFIVCRGVVSRVYIHIPLYLFSSELFYRAVLTCFGLFYILQLHIGVSVTNLFSSSSLSEAYIFCIQRDAFMDAHQGCGVVSGGNYLMWRIRYGSLGPWCRTDRSACLDTTKGVWMHATWIWYTGDMCVLPCIFFFQKEGKFTYGINPKERTNRQQCRPVDKGASRSLSARSLFCSTVVIWHTLWAFWMEVGWKVLPPLSFYRVQGKATYANVQAIPYWRTQRVRKLHTVISLNTSLLEQI